MSVSALLVAEACNVGLTPVINLGEAALTRARLAHVDQYYLRAETIAAANAVLIEAQAKIPIAQAWGGGLLASVDGLRFVVPVRTINAGPVAEVLRLQARHHLAQRGQRPSRRASGRWWCPAPRATPCSSWTPCSTSTPGRSRRWSPPTTPPTATWSSAIFAMLGYRFAPRFADLDDQRFWRAPLPDSLPRSRVSPEQRRFVTTGRWRRSPATTSTSKKIATQWPDMLRVAGSLVTNQVRAYDLLRMFGRDGHPTPLGQAFAEYGRIAKTLHLLALVDPVDDTYRRR